MDFFAFLNVVKAAIPLVRACAELANDKTPHAAGQPLFGTGPLNELLAWQMQESAEYLLGCNAMAQQQLAQSMDQMQALNQMMWQQFSW